MENNFKINAHKILWFISLIIYIKFGLRLFSDLFHIIEHKNIDEIINQYVLVLENFIFFGSLLTIWFKKWNAFSIAIVLGFLEYRYSFFSSYIGPIILPSQQGVSLQFVRLTFFIIVLSIFLIKSIWKRKINDIFLTLSMVGVLGTASLFHVITIQQLNYFTANQAKSWSEVMQNHNINEWCKIQKIICQKINNGKINNNQYLQMLYNHFKPNMNHYQNYFQYFISIDPKIQDRLLSRKPLAFVKYNQQEYYMLDNINYTKYIEFNQKLFNYLAITSHIVWIFGPLFLIWFHEKKFKKRKKN